MTALPSLSQLRTFLKQDRFSKGELNEKCVSAECLDQHAESVRSPEMALASVESAIGDWRLAIP